jgi:hypothetical protein
MLKAARLNKARVDELLGQYGSELLHRTLRLLCGEAVSVRESNHRLESGIVTYQHLLTSNCDGHGTAHTMSFTLANHHWVAPLQQSAVNPEDTLVQQRQCRQWMRRLNGTAGEVGDLLLQKARAPHYVE